MSYPGNSFDFELGVDLNLLIDKYDVHYCNIDLARSHLADRHKHRYVVLSMTYMIALVFVHILFVH
jgi:hypothetical protein